MRFRFRGARYREAGVRDVVRMALNYLWDWIYRAGLSKKQVKNTLLSLVNCDVGSRTAGVIPESLLSQVAKLMSSQGWNCGDLADAIDDALETPPPGYRWSTDKFGHTTLVKVRSDAIEQPIVKGKRFLDDVFIGAWWTTSNPRGSANRQLKNYIKRKGGAIFWNEKIPDQTGRQYGAFIITPIDEAELVSEPLCDFADRIEREGGGEYRLSAIKMAGIAEHRPVKVSDQIWVGCIRSIKFNWKYNLDDLLNKRVEQFKNSPEYRKLIEEIRAR